MFIITCFCFGTAFAQNQDETGIFESYILDHENGIKLATVRTVGKITKDGKTEKLESVAKVILFVALEDPDSRKRPFIFADPDSTNLEKLKESTAFKVTHKGGSTYLIEGFDTLGKLKYKSVVHSSNRKRPTSGP